MTCYRILKTPRPGPRKAWLMYKIAPLLLLILLCSCCRNHLTVYTDYVSHHNLASYYIATPDPALNNPPIGQRLIVSWTLPKSYGCYDDVHLDVAIRLKNRELVAFEVPIYSRLESYVYPIMNERYCETGGILSYKINLVADGLITEEWRHQFWVDLIEFE